MVLRSLSNNDPEIEVFKEKIQRYTGQFEPFGFTHQLYLKEDQPVGIAFIGQEPLQCFKPVGTPFIRFFVIDYNQPKEIHTRFLDEVLKLAKERKVDYAYMLISTGKGHLTEHLEKIGFQELANRYEMTRLIEDPIAVSDQLRYQLIKRVEVGQFFTLMKEFMSGSPDIMQEMVR